MTSFTNDLQRILLASLIFVMSICGLCFNGLSIYVVLKNPLLKNAFGILCFSHCIANIGVLTVFLVYATPISVIEDDHLWKSRFAKHLGQLNILFWDACVYSHLAISINRFITITFPSLGQAILTRVTTIYVTICVWIIAICHVIPYFWTDHCYILYHPSTLTWNFSDNACGVYISRYFDFFTGCSVFAVIAVLDTLTLFSLRLRNNMVHTIGSRAHRRRQVELRFFLQACVQGLLFFYELLNFYFVSTLHDSVLYVFFTSTFAWNICHTLDGLVLFLFQYKAVFSKHCRSTNTVTVSNPSHPRVTIIVKGH